MDLKESRVEGDLLDLQDQLESLDLVDRKEGLDPREKME